MTNRFWMMSVALLGLPVAATAQVRAGVDARAEAGAAVETRRVETHAAVRAAAEAGLPQAPVRREVARGEARGASAAQIDRAAAAVLLRMEAARDGLRRDGQRDPSGAEVEAGAEALAAGATRVELEALGRAAPAQRSLVAALTTLAQLRAGGAEATAAADIAARLASGAPDGAILDLGAAADVAARAGATLGGGAGVGGAAAGVGGAASGAATGTATGAAGALGGAVSVGVGVAGSLGGSR